MERIGFQGEKRCGIARRKFGADLNEKMGDWSSNERRERRQQQHFAGERKTNKVAERK
jgi:hypothetical protein